MLWKTECKQRSGWQRMRWSDSLTYWMDMNLGKFREIVEASGAWSAIIHGVANDRTWLSNWTTTAMHILYNYDLAVLCVYVRVCAQSFSRVWLSVTPWTVAYQAPLSTEFSRHEYWRGFPFPSPEYLLEPGIERSSLWCLLYLQADSLPLCHLGSPIPGNNYCNRENLWQSLELAQM